MNMGHGRLFSFAGSGYATAVTAEDAKVIDILHALCFIFLAILNLKFIIIMQKVTAAHHVLSGRTLDIKVATPKVKKT
mgnify:CR=1 FL=1